MATSSYQLMHIRSRRYAMPIGVGVVSIIAVLLFVPIILNMIKFGNDYPAHLFSAETWTKFGYLDRPRPQFLFHVLIVFLYRFIPGMSISYAGLLLGLIYYVVLTLIIFILIMPLFAKFSPTLKLILSVILTIILMLVGPINLLTITPPNLYFGYIPSNAYHNPTVALLKPLALLLFVYACRVFTGQCSNKFHVIMCALISALGTMAKPSYAIVIIPVLGLMSVVYWWRKQPINWLLLIAGIALPIAIVLLWQQNYYQGQDMGRFIFAPFLVMGAYSPDNLLVKFILSILFPLCVFIFYYRQALRDKSLQIAWLGLIVGAFYTYFLAESVNWADGNFTWSGQVVVFILFVASLIFFIRQNRTFFLERRFTFSFLFCSFILLLHLAGGMALYIATLRTNWLLSM